MKIIPAIDIIDGKCVRLSKGNYNTKKIYSENPLEIAKKFENNGIKYLHIVDLDGAKTNQIVNYNIIEEIASKTNLKIDFGGGLKSDEDLKIAFNSGVNQLTIGSVAVQKPNLFLKWLQHYGPNKIILGADFINRKIATNGWLKTSELDIIEFIKEYEQKGVKHVICTDISKDGMLEGTSNKIYVEIIEKTNIQLIASGGISTFEDLVTVKKIGCKGVIIGKAIYENKISLKKLQELC